MTGPFSVIAEAFLVGALALRPVFVGSAPDLKTTQFKYRAQLFNFLRTVAHTSQPLSRPKPRILVVDDYSELVDELHILGLDAWAMSPFVSVSPWMFQGRMSGFPVGDGVVDIAYMARAVESEADLKRLARTVRGLGFLVVNTHRFEALDIWLRKHGWERLPLAYNKHLIYRRRVGTAA